MSDSGIKKVIVPKDKLGIVGSTNEYVIRYRVVSEDKNRTSYWSPSYIVLSSPIDPVSGDVNIVGNTVVATWENDLQRTSFDIFVGFNNQTPKWVATTTTNTYSFLKTGTLPVRVIVQVRSIGQLEEGVFSTVLNSDLEIYDSGQVNV